MNKEQVAELIARANNIIMKGSYTGDDIFEAAEVMLALIDLYKDLSNE